MLTVRERLAEHRRNPECAVCHDTMDPLGLAFEHYDPVGAWRETEGAGVPVQSAGVLTYSSQQGPFDGAVELSRLAADAPEVRACFVTQWFRSTWGRDAQPSDQCTTEALYAAILAKQTPDAEKRARADFVIDTSQGLDAARDRVREILDKLRNGQLSERT